MLNHRRTHPLHAWILVLALGGLVLGCSSGDKPPAQARSAAGSAASSNHFVGTVGETMDSGGYTYVRLDRGEDSIWAAGPITAVKPGDEIEIELGMKMEKFHSETLQRTFDAVYFVTELGAPGHAHPASDGASGEMPPAMDAHGRSAAPSPDEAVAGAIEPPDGGYRVGDLWAVRKELAGKQVSLRGKVVKYNAGIMGRNWLHIQDGSGDSAADTHDLTVTTQSSCAVGEVVTVQGVVVVDKDFGAGYRYELLLEEATVEVE